MVYKMIKTDTGCEVLQPLTENELRLYNVQKRQRKIKEDREQTVSAYIGSAIAVLFFIGMIVQWIVCGY